MTLMNTKFLVVLAGCGAKDGAEIHESVLTLLAIDKAGEAYDCAALNKKQHHVMNFIDDSELPESRNIMVEAARISRGKILDLAQVSMKDYAGVIFPGGFGVAKNLCDFAFKGVEAGVDEEVARIINEAYDLHKPIGAICIAPALIALVLSKKNPDILLTLGTDELMNQTLKQIGVQSNPCLTTAFVCDTQNKISSSPAYMHGSSRISELEIGITKCVNSVIAMSKTV